MDFTKWLEQLVTTQRQPQLTSDDVMVWTTDGTSRQPPQGWIPEYMNMGSANALRAAYKNNIPPGMAHKIAEFVFLFSGYPLNYEKRLITWIKHKLGGDDAHMSDIIAKKKEMEPTIQKANLYHKQLISKGYVLPSQGRPNGITYQMLMDQ